MQGFEAPYGRPQAGAAGARQSLMWYSRQMPQAIKPAAKSASASNDPFEIASITKTQPPAGVESASWYHYVIRQGSNTINGRRQGTLKNVTKAVEEVIERLNERRMGKAGRVHLTPSPKRKKS